MTYVPLGGTGAVVSALCLGTVTFGRETLEDESQEIVSAFLDAGGNFIDTADMYGGEFGASERILGSALRGKRDNVTLEAFDQSLAWKGLTVEIVFTVGF